MQTYKTKNPSQHHTPGTHKHAHKDAAKKKDARVHYTVLTQHTHTTTTTHHKAYKSFTCRPTRQPQPHTTQLACRPCAAPDTQQHANIPKTMFAEHWSHTHAAQSRSIQPCRCASTRNLYKTKKWQSHLRRHQPPTHNRGHKNKSSLERR